MKVDHNPENITLVLLPWQAALIHILLGHIASNIGIVNEFIIDLSQMLREILENELPHIYDPHNTPDRLNINSFDEVINCLVEVNPDGSGLIYVNQQR